MKLLNFESKQRNTRLLPEKEVCQRYGVKPMTLWRWSRDPDLGFPQPIKIRKRLYRYQDELDDFDERTAKPAPISRKSHEREATGERPLGHFIRVCA